MAATKLEYFEYSVSKLIEWSCEEPSRTLQDFHAKNDFSKLKVLKLHFFLCAINSNSNSLLNLFNSFYALPYGHVESDLYNAINANELKRFIFSDSKITINDGYVESLLDSFDGSEIEEYKGQIDDSIASLKNQNYQLINYSALDLVELSHLWTSWKVTFKLARSRKSFSEKIPSEAIQSDSKFFSLAI